MVRPRPLPAIALLAALVVAVILVVTHHNDRSHYVSMTVPRATGIISGFAVRLDGRPVGSIADVKLLPDYRVKLRLKLKNEAWPLPTDTRFFTRINGTIKYSDRYLQIVRGKAGTMLPDDATLPARAFVDAVEVDTIFNTFDGPTRKDLAATLRTAGTAMHGVQQHLPSALVDGPAAATSVHRVLGQLGDDPAALRTLVRSASDVAGAAAAADPGVGALIDDSDRTLSALAARAAEIRTTLEQLPPTLVSARAVLTTAGKTVAAAGDLTRQIRPGVTQLRAVALPLSRLLVNLRAVGPDARSTLISLDRATPSLNPLIDVARKPILPRLASIGKRAAKQVSCIRPFAPEIAGLASLWSGMFSRGDTTSKYVRLQAGVYPWTNETPLNSKQLQETYSPGLKIAFPRPPGEIVGKPWFQPECGITKDALDLSKDPESQPYDLSVKKIIEIRPPAATGATK